VTRLCASALFGHSTTPGLRDIGHSGLLGRLAVAVGFVEPLGEPAVLAVGIKKVASLVKH
jgi:hypothetical protein